MSVFDKIADAIFGAKPKPAQKPASAPASPGGAAAPVGSAAPKPGAPPTAQPQPQPQPVSVINVENSLDSMPGADRLNWRTSIVDLMKLINVDSDFESRKALAAEMGRTDYKGDADDNVWLHQRVMQELAKNGGKVPETLRD